ncbi:hypothetical protein ACU8KH_05752 [Lachancea thermotolerans]
MSSTQPKARVNVKKPRLSYDQNALDLPALLQGGSETPTNTKLFKHGQNHPLPEHALPHQQKGQTEVFNGRSVFRAGACESLADILSPAEVLAAELSHVSTKI